MLVTKRKSTISWHTYIQCTLGYHKPSQLTDQLERASSKGSRQSSKASSRLSARDRERVRLAELKAERSMLKQKQALRAAEEDLELELEIVKAEVREKALDEIDKEQVLPLSCGSGPPSVVASFFPNCGTISTCVITQ